MHIDIDIIKQTDEQRFNFIFISTECQSHLATKLNWISRSRIRIRIDCVEQRKMHIVHGGRDYGAGISLVVKQYKKNRIKVKPSSLVQWHTPHHTHSVEIEETSTIYVAIVSVLSWMCAADVHASSHDEHRIDARMRCELKEFRCARTYCGERKIAHEQTKSKTRYVVT